MRLLHPGVMVAYGLFMAAVGLWVLVSGETFFGTLCLLLASLSVPGALANAAVRRRVQGDPRPLSAQPGLRLAGLFRGVEAATFLAVGLWGHTRGEDAFLQTIFFVMAAALGLSTILDAVTRLVAARVRRREGPKSLL